MLVTGLMMNFTYSQATTIESLKSLGALESVFNFMQIRAKSMTREFEVKRLLIGLSSLVFSENTNVNELMPYYPILMNVIVTLC